MCRYVPLLRTIFNILFKKYAEVMRQSFILFRLSLNESISDVELSVCGYVLMSNV